MADLSQLIFDSTAIIMDKKISELKFDKTVEAQIFSIDNLDVGQYKVRYGGNIFTVYSNDLNTIYSVGDKVFVSIPEGDFSKRKTINGKTSGSSLSAQEKTELQNTITPVGPTWDKIYTCIDWNSKEYSLSTEKDKSLTIAALNNTSCGQYESYNNLFKLYAEKYSVFRIKAKFLTQFVNPQLSGNYGLRIGLDANNFKEDGSAELREIVYTLDLSSFNGNPYNFGVWAEQEILITVQNNYLQKLRGIEFFVNGFGQGTAQDIVKVKDIEIQFIEIEDLSSLIYYLQIKTPQGTFFSENNRELQLQAYLYYNGRSALNDRNSQIMWFRENASINIGDVGYDKNAGVGWEKIGKTANDRFNELTVAQPFKDKKWQPVSNQKYKVVVIYNDNVIMDKTVDISTVGVDKLKIEQITTPDNIRLQLNDSKLSGAWYRKTPDGNYNYVGYGNYIDIKDFLNYAFIDFYCMVFTGSRLDKKVQLKSDNQTTEIKITQTNFNSGQTTGSAAATEKNENNLAIDTAWTEWVVDYIYAMPIHRVVSSTNQEDVIVSYNGEDVFRYDANGDITIEDSERERKISCSIAWADGVGSAYKIEWLMGNTLLKTGVEIVPTSSMLTKISVDAENIVHFSIRQKYNINYNNNIITLRITTVDNKVYEFPKEILFTKDGDQGTNGTTYIATIRPCTDDGLKYEKTWGAIYNGGTLSFAGGRNLIKAFVYKDGIPIQNGNDYTITFQWNSENLTLAQYGTDLSIRSISGIDSSKTIFYVKAQITIKDKATGKKTILYPKFPIDVIIGNGNYEKLNSNIPSYVKYTNSGVHPSFYNDQIKVIYDGTAREIKATDAAILGIKKISDDEIYLAPPATMFTESLEAVSPAGSVQSSFDGLKYIHTVIMYLDTYGNEAINGWDGQELVIDENGGYILAPQIGAGKKNDQNQFSGVVLGQDSTQSKVGLYGYQNGTNTFGFLENGTGYIGASGKGQLAFDGNGGTITSGNYAQDKETGMKIDFTEGMIESYEFKLKSKSLEFDSLTSTFKFDLHSGTEQKGTFKIVDGEGKNVFYVSDSADGSYGQYYLRSSNYEANKSGTYLNLTNGSLKMGAGFSVSSNGSITATKGTIGGWYIDDDTLSGGGTTLNSDGTIDCSYLIADTAGSIGGWDIGPNGLTAQSKAIGLYTNGDLTMKGTITLGPSGELTIDSSGMTLGSGSAVIGLKKNGALEINGFGISMGSGGGDFYITNGSVSITLTGSDFYLQGAGADEQHGIYARFA